MPLAREIQLPVERAPRWPPLCVLCGRHKPGSVFQFKATFVSAAHLVTPWLSDGNTPVVQAPACVGCAKLLGRQRWKRRIATVAITIAGALAAFAFLSHMGWTTGPYKPYLRWIGVGLAVVVLAPLMIWQIVHPPVVDARHAGKKVTYQFEDAEYAKLFAEENEVRER